jgi:vacuolar-type H+-ATPase subunit E/Vma4
MTEATGTPAASTEETPPAPPAEAKKTEPQEHMIPKSRLDEVSKAAKAEKKRADELEARLKAIEDAQKSELEKAQETAAKATKDAESAKAALEAEKKSRAVLEAATAAGFAKPSLALKLIDYPEDADQLETVVTEFLEANPELRAKAFPGKGDGGAGTGGQPPEKTIDQQIEEAQAAGNVAEVIALTNRKFLDKEK